VKLVEGMPEPLVSRFLPTHGMILNLLARPGGGCMAIARLIKRSHERPAQQRIHGRAALTILRSLIDAGIVTRNPGEGLVVHVDLQEDFSLHHALSLWLVDTLPLIQAESETYALDVLTLVESILEDPDFILRQQVEALRREKLAELKQAGVEYEERMQELEKIEYPKPQRDFIYGTFNAFALKHPWVAGENIRPKSIAREMYERFMSFNEYVREYELARAEGVLLRYLSEVYKALVQTVPLPAKTAETEEIEVFLGAMVRAVDASLLEEWEQMRAPVAGVAGREAERDEGPDVTRDERAFVVLLRNAMFQLVRALAKKDWPLAAQLIALPKALPASAPATTEWPASRIEAALAPFFAEHATIRLDPAARAPANTRLVKTNGARWEVVQVICDAEDANDWHIQGFVDLDRSRAEGRPLIIVERIGT
jgi:hypothetical protein